MFKTLSGLTDNAFWRVSADTKTCGSPQKMSPSGGLSFACWQIRGNFNIISNKSQKKRQEKDTRHKSTSAQGIRAQVHKAQDSRREVELGAFCVTRGPSLVSREAYLVFRISKQ